MEAVARECASRNVILASDEVWSGLILDDVPFTPAGSLDTDVRLISITSASKTYNVAGLDVAFAVVEDDGLRRRYFRAGRDQAEVPARAGKESEFPNFKGSYLGRFPLVSADPWTSDHLSERSRSVDAFSGTRARGKKSR